MKKLFFILAVALGSLFFFSCEDDFFQDKPIAPSELMNPIQEFVSTYFPDCTIVEADMDSELSGVTYDVDLSCDVELEFNSKGEWICVDCGYTKVPDAIIPSSILTYVTEQYPSLFIVHIDKEKNGYEVELNNELELIFDKNGKFVRIDVD